MQGREAGSHVILKSHYFMQNSSFCLNIESIFIHIFLAISKPILVGVLYRPPGKRRFIEYLDNSLKESDISNIQEPYLVSHFNVNLLSGNKMLLVKNIMTPTARFHR